MIKLTLQLAVLTALLILCFIGVFSTPLSDSPSWLADFLVWKIIGVTAGFAAYTLFNTWTEEPSDEKAH